MDKQTFSKVLNENRFKTKHHTQSKIDTISQSNLQQLVYWYAPKRLIYKNNRFFIEGANGKVVLYENMAYNHYTGQSYPPIWFLQEFLGLSFHQAVYLLEHFYYKVQKAPIRAELAAVTGQSLEHNPTGTNESLDLTHYIAEDKLSDPTTKADALKRAIAYLSLNRGIDKDIVLNLIKQKFLVMDSNYNLCFVTYQDPLNKKEPIAITKKGTLSSKPYKCNIVKEHSTGFFYAQKNFLRSRDYRTLFVFESIVDMLSFLTLVKQKRIDATYHDANCCYIALNGANNLAYIDKVLGEFPTIDTILLGLDNDTKGMEAARQIESHVTNTYSEHSVVEMRYLLKDLSLRYGYCKDFNDALHLKGIDFLGEV